jgi:modification methylase
VIEGDARSLPGIPRESVHLVVTSPPYPMIPHWDALFAGLGATEFESMHRVLDGAWEAVSRVLVSGGVLAVNIGDALRRVDGEFRLWANHARVLESVERLGLRPLPYILWQKPTNRPNAFLGSGFVPPNAYVTLDCEPILLFRKGPLRRYLPHEPARERSRFTKAERDRWFSQVWRDIRGVRQGPENGRTSAFPEEIPRRLVRMFSVEGETVLDPFAGTGTTLWAAAALGRPAVGVEIDRGLAAGLSRRAEEWNRAAAAASGGARPPR